MIRSDLRKRYPAQEYCGLLFFCGSAPGISTPHDKPTMATPESSAPARTRRPSAPTKNSSAPTSKVQKIDTHTPEEIKAAVQQYGRGDKIIVKNIKDKKLRGNLKRLEYKFKAAATNAKDAEMLLGEERGYLEAEGMERTYKFSQKELVKAVDVSTAQKGFDLKLPLFGPYSMDYTRNGRYLLLGGLKGHVAAFDWRDGKLATELQLHETVRDVKSVPDSCPTKPPRNC